LRKLFRKQIGNSAICFGWLLVALRLLIPLTLPNPVIHEIRPAYVNDAIIRPIAGQVKVRVVDAIGDLGRVFWQAGNRQAYADLQKVAVGVDYNGYPEILAWIWLGGCMLVLFWFIYKNVQFRTALKKNRIEEISGELKEIYLQLCRERKVKPVPVDFTDPVPGACLVGVFKPYIVLPLITAPQPVQQVQPPQPPAEPQQAPAPSEPKARKKGLWARIKALFSRKK
jgi:beta-lactamase regulating signal transducer with metallopeptidase domain